MAVTVRDLGEPGREWTKKCLGSGREFSEFISQGVELGLGHTVLPWPTPALPNLPERLGATITHSATAPVPGVIESLLGVLRPLLEQGSLMVIEDDMRGPTEPNLQATEHSATVIGSNTVFHLDDADGLTTPDQLHSFIGASGSGYPLNAFLFSGISRDLVIRSLERSNYGSLAVEMDAIVNTIFDCDAFSVWFRNETYALMVEGDTAAVVPA